MTVGLLAATRWALGVGAVLVLVEWAAGFAARGIPLGWAPGLAVGLYLMVEVSVSALERLGALVAPREPPLRRLVESGAVAAGVGLVGTVVLRLSTSNVTLGGLVQIAGVAAAAAAFTIVAWLLRERV